MIAAYKILKDDEISLITVNSRQDLLLKIMKLDEVSAKDFYIDILNAVKHLISLNKTQPLDHFNWLLNKISIYKNEQKLLQYFENAKTRLHNFNPIIFACKSKAIDVLRHILLDKKKTLYNLSCKIHNKFILPNDVDEFNHSAFYYAVRSNIIDLLSILINKWPNKYIDNNLEEIDCVLSKSYQELKLKNVFLTKEMELYVQNQILNIRFFHKNSNDTSSGKSMDHTKKRIELVIENIQEINSTYLDSEPDEEFIYVAEFIAKNIHVLKSDLKSTYDKLPWEEIEFCLAIFIESCKRKFEANLVYTTVLKKERLLQYLGRFSEILKSEKEKIKNNSIKKLRKKLDLKRHTVLENIIQNDPTLQNLYADYEKVRDFYSLETIQQYTKLAVSADVSTEGKLLIMRALQVTGEHIKNSLDSPKLSNTTAYLLLSSLPLGTRDVIEKLRDCLSHKNCLKIRSEIEKKAYNFFKDMQSDILNMNNLVTEVLSKIKREQMKILLLKLKKCKHWREIKKLLEIYYFSFESIAAEIEKMDRDALFKSDWERLKELLLSFFKRVERRTAFEDSLFQQIQKMIQTEESNCKIENEEISLIIQKLYHVAKFSECMDLDDTCDLDLMSFNFEISDISNPPFSNLKLALVKQLLDSVIRRVEPGNIELWQIVWKIFHLIEFQMGKVKWIKEFTTVLCKRKHKKIYLNDLKIQQVLSSKISLIKKVLRECNLIDDLDKLLKPNLIFNFENNKKLQAVMEMLVLDILSLLEDSCTRNTFFLDNDFVLQTGRNLRNNLAHVNSLIRSISPMAIFQLLLNAYKLLTENIENNSKDIGQVEKCDSDELKITHERKLCIIRNQKALFLALSEGNMEIVQECVKKGADTFGKDLKSTSCLHFSSKAPNIEAIKYSLKQGLDINSKDLNEQTALHVAAKFHRLQIVEFLLKKGASVNISDTNGMTPLHIAAENNSQEIIKCLLKHKARTSSNVFRFPPLHHAIFMGSIEAAEILLKNETNVDRIKAHGGITALYIAAEKGNPYLLRMLIEKKASTNSIDDLENTPLHNAARKSLLDAVEILISNGAEVNARNLEGNTPLHGAAKSGNESIVNCLLLNNANIYEKNYHLCLPLHCAAENGHLNIAELFLKMDCTIVNEKNCFGQTPLHFAAHNGHEKLVKLLLNFNAIVDSLDSNNATALHFSVYNGHLNVVQSLVKKKANINAIGTIQNCKPLYIASQRGCYHIAKYLISEGADIHSRDANALFTPLEIAAMLKHTDIVKLLLKTGAHLEETFRYGHIPFHLTVLNALNELLLVENKNMSLSIGDNFETLIRLAAEFGDKYIIEFCINMGCNVNAKNEFEVTALHLAALNNHLDTVTFLFEHGADIDCKDANGYTALCYAVIHNSKKTAIFLITKRAERTQSSIDDRNESLYLAVTSGHDDIIDMLFLNCEFDIDSLEQNYDFLHKASQFGHRKVVDILLEKKFKINFPWKNRTPLYYAVINNNCEIARILISEGANVNAQDAEGKTALHWIVGIEVSSAEMLQILLNGEADVSIRDKKNQSVIEIAVRSNRLEMVKILLQRKHIDINLECNRGFTLLHISAENGSLEITKYLILKGAIISAKDINGSKPIHIAAEKGHKNVVEFYLNKNVEINYLGHQNFTPLHYAAFGSKENVCEYLIERGADINALAYNGMTPISIAIMNGNEEIFRILLHNGAYYNPFDTSSSLQLSATKSKSISFLLKVIEKLFIAVENNIPSEVEIQLRKADCHQKKFNIVNAKCVRNETLLVFASKKGYEEIIEILLTFKANPNICDNHKRMPLHHAAMFSHFRIVKALLMNGAMYNDVCFIGKSPLEYATDSIIINLLCFADRVFTKTKENNDSVFKDLKNPRNEEFSKVMMRAKHRNGKTLVASAIFNDFSKIEQLKELFQDDIINHWKSVDTLISQHNLPEALVKLNVVLDRRIEIFGEENPATLDVKLRSARVILNLQKNDEALDLLQEIYQKRKKIFGEYHEESLTTKYLIALVFRRQEKRDKAYLLLKEVLKHKDIFKKNYLDFLCAQMELSLILAEMERFDEALKISNDVLNIRENEFKSAYCEINLQAQDKKAMILAIQGNFLEAKEIFEKIYSIRKDRLPTNHVEVLRSQSSIAKMLYQMKKYDESLRIYKDIRKILKYHYPSNYVCILSNESDIARIFFLQGMSIKALKKFLDIELKITKFEENHSLVKKNKKDIESVLFRLKLIDCEWLVEKIRGDLRKGEVGNQLERLKYLEVNINSQDEKGRTALHIAVDNGERELINSLLEKGSDICMVTKDGKTVLHFASAKGYSDIAELILNHGKRRTLLCAKNLINLKDSTLSTALHLVSNVKTAKCLLKNGAVYNEKNDVFQTPLDLAADEKIFSLLKTLDNLFNAVRNGAHNVIQELHTLDPEEALAVTNARNCQGYSLLQVAVAHQQYDLAREIGNWLKKENYK